jgi:tetratricopeptide (TPR) repeat protein
MTLKFHKKIIVIASLILGSLFITLLLGLLIRLYPDSTYRTLLSLNVPSTILGRVYGDNPTILYNLGSRHIGGGGTYDLVLAEQFLSAAIAINEKQPYAHYQRARIFFLNYRYAKARSEVNKEIEYNPDFSRSYYLRGLVNGYDGKYEAAAEDFAEFIKRNPEEWAGYADRAWVLFQLGDYIGVKETMEAILPRIKNAWLLNAYGVALLNLGENEKALTALREAKDLASRMTPEMWGVAYIGNNPRIYTVGLEEMQKNIDENVERVNNALSEKE